VTVSAEQFVSAREGPLVIFQHGSFMDETMFAPQIEAITSVGWRGISYRSRALTHPQNIHTLDDLAEDCRAVANAEGVSRFVLCGMSVGAFMAIEFALKYPERLIGLVMIDGKAAAYSSKEREVLAPKFEDLDTDGPLPEEFAQWIAPLCFGETTRCYNAALVDEWMKRWTRLISSRSAHRQYLSWIDKPDRRDQLAHIKIETLLFHGEEDTATPKSHSLEMAQRLPRGELIIVPKAGHTSNLEQPGVVNAALIQFLNRLRKQLATADTPNGSLEKKMN
jgi:3-oxoadipate enol-lactonase